MKKRVRNEPARDIESVFSRRVILLGGGAALGFLVLGGRLFQIQVTEADRYATLSDDNQFNYRLLTPSRGRILDRFGEPIAENEENYTVVLIPENAREPEAVLDHLAQLVPLSEEGKQQVLREIARTPGFRQITVIDDLDWRQFAMVNLHAPELPGVLPMVGETRFYPHGPTFAHITGYVGKADEATAGNDPLLNHPSFRVGREGMERALDETLRGAAGSLKVEVDAFGRVVRELPDPATAAKAGADVRLTLDAGLQQFAMETISVERAASAVVIDVRTGDILALASHPAYDPNHFTRGMSSAEYRTLTEDEARPLYPWVFAGQYAPGSTFKPVVAMAASRFGVIDPAERVYCGGSMRFGNSRRYCWKAHGSMDLHNAIKNSCDVYFYEAARRLGVDRIAEVANEFGLGHAPDLPLPGVRAGIIPTEAWKLANRNEPWQGGETPMVGIGQSFVSTTPLQLALMTARMATGRQVIPRLVLDGAPQPFAPLDYPLEAFEAVRWGMRGVCHEPGGTGYYSLHGVLDEHGVEMGGKSGTSQVRNISAAERASGVIGNDQLPWRRRDHALFIAFGPYSAPRYAVAAVVEHGGGGSAVTGPMARDILLAAIERNSGRNPDSPMASL